MRRGKPLGGTMAKKDLVPVSGAVAKILGGGRYQIRLDNGHEITAQLSGRMRRFRIRVIVGDRVQCGVSPYDPTHGFITYREPPGGSAAAPPAPRK
jgi:translation initiation factor IF-1